MKVTYNWLKDFVEIKLAPQALADKLTMAGLEVVSLEEREGDFIFEIEITSNRPDWLSVYGVAREVAAITGKKLKEKSPSRINNITGKEELKISVENKKDCPLYTARIIRDLSSGKSPGWLRDRLELIGCRSVNNIVDLTNYLLFETGQPMHAFDLDKLAQGEIIIRRAKANEKIITIDAVERNLDPGILIISDASKPIAIAGIMGGKNSEVGAGTKNILLESAIFAPILVRQARQKLGLQSEAAYRFERGVNAAAALEASAAFESSIKKICAGTLVLFKSSGQTEEAAKKIKLEAASIKRILGADIAPSKCKSILISLGFKVKSAGKNNLLVTLPQHRKDIRGEADLTEEIARIYGFENIPKTLAAVIPSPSIYDTRDLVSMAKEILLGLGMNEAITYSLIDRDSLEKFGFEGEPVAIRNPLSKEQEFLRPTILPSLINCIARNLNQKQEYINFFEVAKTFSKEKNQPKEELVLGLALCGEKRLFCGGGVVKDEVSLLNIKGLLETLFNRLEIKEYSFEKAHPQEYSLKIKGEKIGRLLSLPKEKLEAFEIKNNQVVLAELSLDKVLPKVNLEKKFIPAAKYPGITRDLSFIIKEDLEVNRLLEAINSVGLPLRRGRITDYYCGKQIPEGFRALTVSCDYRLDERTLTEEEINPLQARISKILLEDFGAKMR